MSKIRTVETDGDLYLRAADLGGPVSSIDVERVLATGNANRITSISIMLTGDTDCVESIQLFADGRLFSEVAVRGPGPYELAMDPDCRTWTIGCKTRA